MKKKGVFRMKRLKLLTLSETAEITKLSEKALRMRIFRGEFPFTKLGKRVFVEEAQLEKFLSLSTKTTAEEALEKIEGKAA